MLITLGCILISHAAYSVYQHLAYLRLVDRVAPLPTDILCECFLGVVIASFGIIWLSPPWLPIHVSHDYAKMTLDDVDARPSFRKLNHRGQVMFAPTP